MKFVRFISDTYPSGTYGLIDEDKGIFVLRGGLFDPVEPTGDVILSSSIRRFLPCVDPPNILAIGLNYRDHAAETGAELPKKPLLFIKATNSLSAHNESIILPSAAPDMVDYEAELVVIIGKTARNVPLDKAPEYIFGYSCGHDVSARDAQRGDGQWARAKSFDTFGPIGPYIVTGLDPTNLRIQMKVNNKKMQDSSTSQMIFGVHELVSYLSYSFTLLPGTVIFTGTPSGVGVARSPQVFLQSGDVCEVEIEGIGVLRNTVRAEQPVTPH